MSRNGKIARLPCPIREELNRRMQNGQQSESLLAWLNPLPEVQTVLNEEFARLPISKQNLYEWRKGGFAEWEFRAAYVQDAQETRADAAAIGMAAEGQLADDLATVLTARYTALVRTWSGEVTDEFRAKLKVMQGMIQNVSHLRRWDHNAAKVRMEQELHDTKREKSEEEMIEHFERWIKKPEVHDWISQTWKTPVQREHEKRWLLGRPTMTEAEVAALEERARAGNSKNQHPAAAALADKPASREDSNAKAPGPGAEHTSTNIPQSGARPGGRKEGGQCQPVTPNDGENEGDIDFGPAGSLTGKTKSNPVRSAQAANSEEPMEPDVAAEEPVANVAPVENRDAQKPVESNPVKPGKTTFMAGPASMAAPALARETMPVSGPPAPVLPRPEVRPRIVSDPIKGDLAAMTVPGEPEVPGGMLWGKGLPPEFRPYRPTLCEGKCELVDNVCTGCQRTADEIAKWPLLTADARAAMIARIMERRRWYH